MYCTQSVPHPPPLSKFIIAVRVDEYRVELFKQM